MKKSFGDKLIEFDSKEYFLPRKGSEAEKKHVSWVYEIPTPKGVAYVQAVAWNRKDVFTLIRVIPGRFKKSVEDVNKLNLAQEDWYTCFFIETLARKQLAKRVGIAPVHRKWKSRPPFALGTIAAEGETFVSFVVERPPGSGKMIRVNRLSATEEEKCLSHNSNFSASLFIYRIATGWTPSVSYERTIGKKLPFEKRFDSKWPEFEDRYEEYLRSNWGRKP